MAEGPPAPVFTGTSGKIANACAHCGTDKTAGIWRRGWDVEGGESANLCNRCGLAYKNGKVNPGKMVACNVDDPVAAGPREAVRQSKPKVKAVRSGGPSQRKSAPEPMELPSSLQPRTALSPSAPSPDSGSPTPLATDSHEPPELSLGVVKNRQSQEPILPPAESRKYESFTMAKENLDNGVRQVSFYLHDRFGGSTLAVVGIDTRGTGHFTYKSQMGFEPYLHVTNRGEVMNWLADHIATHSANSSPPSPLHPATNQPVDVVEPSSAPSRPDLGGKYTSYKDESYQSEDGTHHRDYYLVNEEGDRKLAIKAQDGPRRDRRYVYRSTEEFGNISFKNSVECVKWLGYILGMSDTLPQSIRRKKREYQAVALEPTEARCQGKRHAARLPNDAAHSRKGRDIQEAYQGEPQIYEWVVTKPTVDVVGQFEQWARKLSGVVTDDPPKGMDASTQQWTSTQEAVQILQLIDSCETCLRLLEATRISRTMALLRNHQHDELASLARKVSSKWKKTANRALVIARRTLQQMYG
ncbi:unnamed protein product [Ostreobium quekettii]|uniref:GATA-type domain-containing protein n=1 Tax=Ostreobium quekettii TaxID=121088 RepID=A0A8S1IPN7_9CHLO|nr:unnamed protein product [Ostreobium quekettii]|eukprot:evm.model.scf_68EXC.7 EVM.evm.TU.scf_68EXC.7   scf_68EXC:99186-112403(-)